MTPRLCFVWALVFAAALRAEPENRVVLNIDATPAHPRYSEGAFATLKSGRVIFYVNQFDGGAHDESPAQIVEIHSDDRGRTWSQPRVVVDHKGYDNVMDATLLRLASGKLALFYSIKKSAWLDCRPYVRISTDEGATWSAPRPVVVAPGYTGTNNDRAIQTHTGRIIMPVPFNRIIGTANSEHSIDWRAITCWYLSDDDGATWREAPQWWTLPVPSAVGMDEPGVVELADGSLYSWARTDQGRQWATRSTDNGEHWTPPKPTEMVSPNSPASIKRLPHSRALLAIYNDHSGRFTFSSYRKDLFHGRTPLVAAISHDGGETWPDRKVLESDPRGNFCYTAIHFVDDAVLLAYGVYYGNGALTAQQRIRRIDLGWLPQPQHPGAQARAALHEIMAKGSGFERVHASEILIANGEGEAMKRLFEREEPAAESTAYRVGVWRALALASTTPAERKLRTDKIAAVYLDASAPDRTSAIEALCKLGVSLDGPALEKARRQAQSAPEIEKLMALWALALHGDTSAPGRVAQDLASPDDRTRLIAAFVLGWLRADGPEVRRALAAAADHATPGTASYPFILSTAIAAKADPARVAAWHEAFARGAPHFTDEGVYDCCHFMLPALTRADLVWLNPLLDSTEADARIGAAWAILYVLSHEKSAA